MEFHCIATEWNDTWLVKFLIGTSQLLSAGKINSNGAEKLADYARSSHRIQQEAIDAMKSK